MMDTVNPKPLEWKGPIGIGNLPGQEGQIKLDAPHVYIIIQKYTNHTVIYVGQSKLFLHRLWDQYLQMLGFHSFIRDDQGKCRYDPGKDYMLEELNKIDDLFPVVVADTKRIQYCYAECDLKFLDPVESTLIKAVMKRCQSDVIYECDNSRQQNYGYDKPIIVKMKFKDLRPEGKEVLADLFPKRTLT